MTIEKCGIGYRLYTILKLLGIEEKKEKEEGNDNLNIENSNCYELESFVKEIYFNCKKFGFRPFIIFELIKDLFECYLTLNEGDKSLFMDRNFDNLNSNNQQQCPLISQISKDISKKKRECNQLKNRKIKLESELESIKQSIKISNDNLAKITEKERKTLYYLEWFYKLKKLWDKHFIRIENVTVIAKVINDFEKTQL